MAYYSYSAVTRQLIAISDSQLDIPTDGAVCELPDISALELQTNYTWDETAISFVEKPAPRLITKLEYMNRFTDQELAMIYTVAKSNIAVEIWLEKFKLASEISLDDARLLDGLHALENSGLIGPGRAQEIIA